MQTAWEARTARLCDRQCAWLSVGIIPQGTKQRCCRRRTHMYKPPCAHLLRVGCHPLRFRLPKYPVLLHQASELGLHGDDMAIPIKCVFYKQICSFFSLIRSGFIQSISVSSTRSSTNLSHGWDRRVGC